MEDSISRQGAIDAIVNTVSEIGLHDNSEVARYGAAFRQHEIIDIIEGMPSAQPERRYDEWCTDCKEYDHERHCCPRWNRVIRTTLQEVQEERKKGKWIIVTDGRGRHAECPYCGEWKYHSNQKFCGECGARMEVEE